MGSVMYEQLEHDLLPKSSLDEMARTCFVNNLKRVVDSTADTGLRRLFEARVAESVGGLDASRERITAAMEDDEVVEEYQRLSSAFRRGAQELLWDATTDQVERQIDNLKRVAQEAIEEPIGTLELDPSLPAPEYTNAVDIHLMPTGYNEVLGPDDITAGAIYDRGAYVYLAGELGPLSDEFGRAVSHRYLPEQLPDFKPERILEMGCGMGASTLPWREAFPDAEIHAIDAGAGMLRYAHARAEALGKSVHFSQQNAEHTNFDDESFDLVVSHILMHETSTAALRNIYSESYRLLRPGGLMIHSEIPQYQHSDGLSAYLMDWETHNNNEPFWTAQHLANLQQVAVDAGFDSNAVSEVIAKTKPLNADSFPWSLGLIVGKK